MKTINDLHHRLEAAGIDPDGVMWEGERAFRDGGTVILSRGEDGRIRSATWERGKEQRVEYFDDEQQAATALWQRLSVFAQATRGTLTDEERARIAERTSAMRESRPARNSEESP